MTQRFERSDKQITEKQYYSVIYRQSRGAPRSRCYSDLTLFIDSAFTYVHFYFIIFEF